MYQLFKETDERKNMLNAKIYIHQIHFGQKDLLSIYYYTSNSNFSPDFVIHEICSQQFKFPNNIALKYLDR